jgi:hypothetical protein
VAPRKKKKRTEKEYKEDLERLERMVEGLEKHRDLLGDDPKWDYFQREGRRILDEQKEANRKVDEAKQRWIRAKKELDVAARDMLKKFGRRNLEVLLVWLVQQGQDERAEELKGMLEHALMLARRDEREKKRKKRNSGED